MSRIPLVRNASAFCTAVAIASLMSVGGTSAAPLFSFSSPDAGTVVLNSGSQPFNPAFTGPSGPAVLAQMTADFALAGNNSITLFNPATPGGLLAAQNINVTFQFVGAEAGFNNQTWQVGLPGATFTNSTALSGDLSGNSIVNAAAFLPFYFLSNGGNGGTDAANNGGPIAANLTLGLKIISDSVAYAFFDDGGGSPVDADFDDVIIRITATTRGEQVEPTPLPAALPLFASALAGFGFFQWRRKRKTAKSFA
jgi:hypothetical protein